MKKDTSYKFVKIGMVFNFQLHPNQFPIHCLDFGCSDLDSGILTLTGLDLPKNVLIKVSEALKTSPEVIELCLKQSLLTDETLSILLKSLNCDLLHLKVLNLESILLNNDILEELSSLIAQNRSIQR